MNGYTRPILAIAIKNELIEGLTDKAAQRNKRCLKQDGASRVEYTTYPV